MSASAKSVLVFGVYLVGMGAGLLFIPNFVLNVLGFPATGDIWVRVVGVLALLIAFYYIQAARTELRPFFGWTVFARIAAFMCFAAFAVLGLAGPVMLLLGSVDLAGAIWTGVALGKSIERGINTASVAHHP